MAVRVYELQCSEAASGVELGNFCCSDEFANLVRRSAFGKERLKPYFNPSHMHSFSIWSLFNLGLQFDPPMMQLHKMLSFGPTPFSSIKERADVEYFLLSCHCDCQHGRADSI